MMSKFLTIFTPTFNRCKTLSRVYESLCKQRRDDFIWFVLDDGSTDTTEQLIQRFIDENNFEIKYMYQKNQGKQAAWNNALNLCDTSYFMCLDSDDALTDNALTLVADFIPHIEEDESIIGLRFNAINAATGKEESGYFSDKPVIKSWFAEVSDEKYVGEKLDIFKTALLKKFLFPVTEKIKFIPESYMYSSIAKAGYTFVYTPCAIRTVYDDTENNLRLSQSSIKKHAEGHYLYRAHLLKIMPFSVWAKNPSYFFKTLVRFSQTARLSQKTFVERMHSSGSFFCSVLSYPLGSIPV